MARSGPLYRNAGPFPNSSAAEAGVDTTLQLPIARSAGSGIAIMDTARDRRRNLDAIRRDKKWSAAEPGSPVQGSPEGPGRGWRSGVSAPDFRRILSSSARSHGISSQERRPSPAVSVEHVASLRLLNSRALRRAANSRLTRSAARFATSVDEPRRVLRLPPPPSTATRSSRRGSGRSERGPPCREGPFTLVKCTSTRFEIVRR